MRGEPIPGSHWVEVDLQQLVAVDRILVDWEVAYSNDWTVLVRKINWVLLYQNASSALFTVGWYVACCVLSLFVCLLAC
jgi:hypothetical protein